MHMILPGVYCFTGLLVGRVYAIEDPDGFTLIDASLSNAPAKIIKQLAAAGHQPSAIKRILITHAHPDHVGGLQKLQQLTGAEVYASEQERRVIEGEISIPRPSRDSLTGIAKLMLPPDTRTPPCKVHHVLRDGDVISEVMGGLQAVFTPGHAPGHMAFWQPQQRVLFCGDVIMRIFGKLRLPFAMLTVDMSEDKRSIQKVAALDAKIVCFGHGDPWTENTPQVIRAFAAQVNH